MVCVSKNRRSRECGLQTRPPSSTFAFSQTVLPISHQELEGREVEELAWSHPAGKVQSRDPSLQVSESTS